MEELFDIDELETAFGGNKQVSFDLTEYAARMREDDNRRKLLLSENNMSIPLAVRNLQNVNLDSDSDESVKEDQGFRKCRSSCLLSHSLEEQGINRTGSGAELFSKDRSSLS